MLCEYQKANLPKLTDRYNFQYLRPPVEVYQIRIPETEYFSDTETIEPRRRIYYNVPYDARELKIISQIKEELHHHSIHEKISDQLILKHAYMAKFQKEKVIERLKDAINYHRHPIITNFDDNTILRLQRGVTYTYGWDRGMRPIVIIRIDKIDFEENMDDILNSYYYLMLVVYAFRMVPYHAQKVTFIADLGNLSIRKIPIFSLYDQMKKLGTYYCGVTERTLLYNASGLGWLWKIISSFLNQSQKKKMVIIPIGQEKKAHQYIDPYQLETKYGGKLPNLTQFWPPKSTNEALADLDLKSNTSDYFSIENNQNFFDLPDTDSKTGCCSDCKCDIY